MPWRRPWSSRPAAFVGLALTAMTSVSGPPARAPDVATHGAAPRVVSGIDHMPVAVRDLDASIADFERLGFVIKPGRAHDDGIQNAHVKFANHGGIELITASHPTDDLASEYVAWLAGGDGPAWWAAYGSDLAGITRRLVRLGLAPEQGFVVTFAQSGLRHRIFFGDRSPSPTDAARWNAHPNTAYRLARVWTAGGEAERQLLVKLGIPSLAHRLCAPFARRGRVAAFAGGDEAIYVAPDPGRPAHRALIGATVMVRDLATARGIAERGGFAIAPAPACRERSFWIRTHGLWLQFLQ